MKLCSANYAPSGAQNRANVSVKIVRKGRTPTSQTYGITPSEAKIKILYV